MKQYTVNYGAVPYQQRSFRNYADASVFIKQQLDLGIIVRSVSKEECEYVDSREQLIRAVDVIGDR